MGRITSPDLKDPLSTILDCSSALLGQTTLDAARRAQVKAILLETCDML